MYTGNFRHDYMALLSRLHTSSMADIGRLTDMAYHNIRFSHDVVYAIEHRVYNAPPHEKLPALHLADNLIKRIGHPFIGLFSESLERLFFHVIGSVDPRIRQQLMDLLQSWAQVLPEVYRVISHKMAGGPMVAPQPHVPIHAPPPTQNAAPAVSQQPAAPKAQISHPQVLQKMYSPPFQCSICARRFTSAELRDNHMDKHITGTATKRVLYMNQSDWVTFGSTEKAEISRRNQLISGGSATTIQEEVEKPTVSVSSIESGVTACCVCGEEFSPEFNDDNDEWVYIDAIYDEEEQNLYHSDCFNQTKESRKRTSGAAPTDPRAKRPRA
ncbi:hypothetical protein RCL1_004040 [Eukaryota sp. TZLM3-RCL]